MAATRKTTAMVAMRLKTTVVGFIILFKFSTVS